MSFIHRGKKSETFVSIVLDKPLGGLSESDPGAPSIKIIDIDIKKAAQEFPGKTIFWERVPFKYRYCLETAPYRLELHVDEFRKILK